MSHQRRLATAVTATATMLAAVVSTLVLATPARAADPVQVTISQVPSTITAGGGSTPMRVSLKNTTEEEVFNGARVVISVSLPGAPGEFVRVRRSNRNLPGATGDGVIVFTDDSFDLRRQQDKNYNYSLSFAETAPSGQATIAVALLAGDQLLGSASVSPTVIGVDVLATDTPLPTGDGDVVTYTGGPSYPAGGLPGAQPPESLTATMPRSLYVLGGLLIALGLATLYLIFRPPGRRPVAASAGDGPDDWSPRHAPEDRSGGRVSEPPSWHRPEASGPRQAWPTVTRSPAPDRSGPPTGTIRPVRDAGPPTGTIRPIRDPDDRPPRRPNY